ncbi:MAG: hypothetical protein FJW26_16875 [Acidimicrobiia bacterium]|nr:hypothetical protein [Acidimicrobiia bacterium]
MNSRELGHERFEELCALSALGQISAEEFRELRAHLRTCKTCQLRQDDFTEILHEHLPLLSPTDASTPGARNVAFHDASYKQRFIQRAQKEGLTFSPEVAGVTKAPPTQVARWHGRGWTWPKQLAASAALVGLSFWLGSLQTRQKVTLRVPPAPDLAAPILLQPPAAKPEPTPPQLEPQLPRASLESEGQLAKARADYASAVAKNQVLNDQLQAVSEELASLKEEAEKLRTEAAGSAKLKETELALQLAQSELQKLQRERSVYASTFADQQTQIRELMDQLGKQAQSTEQDRQLTAASRDIRQLMGARNLHIIDVEDVEDNAVRREPVGRVFYTEGKSLIFYAFDLARRRKSMDKYSFQAWGQTEAKGGPVQSLGVFVSEDESKNLWVLKCDDPKLLARIDSVFVTIEPRGGNSRPQGRQLMYAYLRANPNHP